MVAVLELSHTAGGAAECARASPITRVELRRDSRIVRRLAALYRQLIESNRLKPVSNEKACLWGVALEVANASGGRNLVVGAHRFFAGTDTFQYYEIVFNSRGEGEWRFAKERHYQYDVAGMEGILEWPTMHAVLAAAGLLVGGGLWLLGLLIAKLLGFVRRRKAPPVF